MIVIEIGPNSKKYNVHKALLMYHSEYFKKALTGTWKEAQEGVVRLDDVDTETFEIFIHWLTPRSCSNPRSATTISIVTAISVVWEWDYNADKGLPTITAYVIGDRLLAEGFRLAAGEVADNLLSTKNFSESYFYKMVLHAFQHIQDNRLILQHLVDVYCRKSRPKSNNIEKHMEVEMKLPRAFMRRALHRYAEPKVDDKEARSYNRCYFEHANTEARGCGLVHLEWNRNTELGHFPKNNEGTIRMNGVTQLVLYRAGDMFIVIWSASDLWDKVDIGRAIWDCLVRGKVIKFRMW